MVRIIAIIVGALLAGVVGIVATRPGTFRVRRAARITAPPERIFALINDFHRWDAWSPYERKDPAMTRSYRGAASGTGAVYEWDGNRQIGKGRMEIIESLPPSKIAIQLDFVKPFKAHNTVEFTLEGEGDATTVTWTMHGPNAFVSKVLSLFLDIERMVGQDFESGLAALKAAAEEGALTGRHHG